MNEICAQQVITTKDPRSGLLTEDLMPLCPLWVGSTRFTNAEAENHFRRVKSGKGCGPRCSLDDFVLGRYRDVKYLLNRAVSLSALGGIITSLTFTLILEKLFHVFHIKNC